MLDAIEQIKVELKERLEHLRDSTSWWRRSAWSSAPVRPGDDAELGYCTGIENYSRYLSGRRPGEPPPTLFDYLPEMRCW